MITVCILQYHNSVYTHRVFQTAGSLIKYHLFEFKFKFPFTLDLGVLGFQLRKVF